MLYAIIDAEGPNILVELVNKHIKDGWVPLGGVSVSLSHDAHGGSYQVYAQAMTKDTK